MDSTPWRWRAGKRAGRRSPSVWVMTGGTRSQSHPIPTNPADIPPLQRRTVCFPTRPVTSTFTGTPAIRSGRTTPGAGACRTFTFSP